MHHHHWHWLGVFFHQQAWLALPLALLALTFASYSVLGLWREWSPAAIITFCVLSFVSLFAAIPFHIAWHGGLFTPGVLGIPKQIGTESAIGRAALLLAWLTANHVFGFGLAVRSKTKTPPAALWAGMASLSGVFVLWQLTAEFFATFVPYIPMLTYGLLASVSVGLIVLWMRLLLRRANKVQSDDSSRRLYLKRFAVLTAAILFAYLSVMQLISFAIVALHWKHTLIETVGLVLSTIIYVVPAWYAIKEQEKRKQDHLAAPMEAGEGI